jgi:LuxR family transcriptional regulator, maltose regulon positive regulatory protein
MVTQSVSLAKTTRPSLAGIIPRERLFRLLDKARGGSVIWVTGPPGCGKTTAAASYLEHAGLPSVWYQLDESDADVASFFYYLDLATARHARRKPARLPQLAPEYHAGLPTFARRYFQALYQRLGEPFALVFDGYHEVPPQSAFHEVMRIGLGELPASGGLAIISRSEPPAQMARLRANRAMEVIGWRELQLTREESDAIVAQRGLDLSPAALADLYEKTQGWAAGLILMMDQAPTSNTLAAPADLSTPGLIFDYLAGEIFQKTDARTRDLMLATAYLPQLTANMAELLTGVGDSGTILAELHHNNQFVSLKQAQPQVVYQYHPLLREFLLARANVSLNMERRTQLQRDSAELLVTAGLPAEAITLLRESGDWRRIVAIIEGHAAVMLDRGMGETVAQWIYGLPQEIQHQHPWVLYWLALSRVSISPREARLLYEQAHALFRKQTEPDLRALLLTSSGAMDAVLYELDDFALLDRWIADTCTLLREHPGVLDTGLEARIASSLSASMMVRQPQHPDLEHWVERAYAASFGQSDPHLRLHVETRVALSIAWAGHYPKAQQIIKGLQSVLAQHDASPFAIGMLKLTEASYYMLTAQTEDCLRAVHEGLDIERSTGAHVMIHQLLALGAGGALAGGDLDGAERMLNESAQLAGPRARFDACLLHLFATWLALLKHDSTAAYQQQRLALTAAIELGSPHFEALCRMAAARVLYEVGDMRGALSHFQRVYDTARNIPNHLLDFTGLMMYASVALESGKKPRSGMRALKLALEIAKPRNYLSFLLWRPDMLAKLCSHALEAGIERDFVSNIIHSRGLVLDAADTAIADWPWPYRVRTLGQFRLLRNDEPVTFAGKAQRRPLDLLRVLIASGAREVPVERITEALWPRIDGDSAHRSFTTTLHRLRKLLGEDRALHLSEGKLTLDGRHVWTDTWAFEQTTARIEHLLRRPRESIGHEELDALCERMIRLYAGPFLANEPDEPWMFAARERLRHRLARALQGTCRHAQQAGTLDRVTGWLERAIEADSTAEGLYRQLMTCYAQLGRRADVSETYDRCRRAFVAMRHSEPSAETRAHYEKLLESA